MAHLRVESFQERLNEDFQIELLLGLVLRTIYSPSDFDPSPDPKKYESVDTKFEDPLSKDDVEQLESLMDALFVILLDISSLSKFAINYPYESSLGSTLSSWLKSQRLENMIVACSMLSGLARAEERWARSMVSGSYRIHHDLINMMASETNTRYINIITISFYNSPGLSKTGNLSASRLFFGSQHVIGTVMTEMSSIESLLFFGI